MADTNGNFGQAAAAARSEGANLRSSGVSAEGINNTGAVKEVRQSPEFEEAVRSGLSAEIANGSLMIVKPEYALNYDKIAKTPDASGRVFNEVVVALDLKEDGKEASSSVNPAGDDRAVIYVNRAALEATPEFNLAYINNQGKFGNLYKLSKEHVANYNELIDEAAKAGYAGEPQIMLDVTQSKNNKNGEYIEPEKEIIELPGGRAVIRINPEAHRVTEEFARLTSYSNQTIADNIAAGKLIDVAPHLEASVLKDIQDAAKSRGLSGVDVVTDTGGVFSNNVYTTGITVTKENRAVLVMGNELFADAPDMQKIVAKHEFAHIDLGHTSAKGLAERHNMKLDGNFPGVSYRETKADRKVICDSPNREADVRDFTKFFEQEAIKHPHHNIEEEVYTHPTNRQRISDLKTVIEYPEVCGSLASPVTPNNKTGNSVSNKLYNGK